MRERLRRPNPKDRLREMQRVFKEAPPPLKGTKETATNFPLQGVYKGVPYRFDGDALMLTCSSGREILFTPDGSVRFFERKKEMLLTANPIKAYVARKTFMPLVGNVAPEQQPIGADNSRNAPLAPADFDEVARAYGILPTELEHLLKLSRTIFINYLKAIRRNQSRSM